MAYAPEVLPLYTPQDNTLSPFVKALEKNAPCALRLHFPPSPRPTLSPSHFPRDSPLAVSLHPRPHPFPNDQ